jgi:ribosomal protein S3AE
LKSKVSGYEKVKQHEEHLYSKTIKLLYRENNSASGLKEREKNPQKRRIRKTMNNVATLEARNNRVNDIVNQVKMGTRIREKILDNCGLGKRRAKE